jgi:putative ABC transport system permease protein
VNRGDPGEGPPAQVPDTERLHTTIAVRDLLAEASAGITRRVARSLLTILGVVLGVGAFVATMGLTTTAAAQISSRFDALKATEVRVQDGRPDPNEPPFPPDTEERLERLNGVESAGLLSTVGTGNIKVRRTPFGGSGGEAEEPLNLMAASPGALRAVAASVRQGRLYDSFHDRRGERVALLGASAARQLGLKGVDQRPAVFINDRPFTVLGIIDDVDRNLELLLSVVVPEGTAGQIWGSSEIDTSVVIHTELGAAQLIGRQAPLALRPDDPDRLAVLVPPDPETLRSNVEADVNALFLLLASVSLVIGAVGIANTTLVSVLERVTEIGLRRALGAARHHVTAQFLTESTVLGTFGGLLGTCGGILIITMVSATRQWTAVIEPATTFLSPLIGTLIGFVAGLYPAARAATIEPVQALNR